MNSSLQRRACIYMGSIIAASVPFISTGYSQGGIFSLGISDDATVGFAWRANSEPDLAGYHLYVGTLPGIYSGVIDVGNTTSFQLADLVRGTTYYFALTAYNSIGLESDFTPEISRQIPLVVANAPLSIASAETDAGAEVTTPSEMITLADEPSSPPEISRIPDQWLSKNRPSDPIPFTITDTSSAELEVVMFSSDPSVVPVSGLTVRGSEGNRSLIIDPSNGRTGMALVTVLVNNGFASTSVTFQVMVGL